MRKFAKTALQIKALPWKTARDLEVINVMRTLNALAYLQQCSPKSLERAAWKAAATSQITALERMEN